MSKLANKIIESLEFDKYTLKHIEKCYVNKIRTVYVDGTKIKVSLDKASANLIYDRMKKKKSCKDILEPEEGTEWIRQNLDGNITKEDLDE